MALDLTTFTTALKEHYTDDVVENLVYEDNPLFAMMAKYEDFGGKNLPIPIIYNTIQGVSWNFTAAQANEGSAAGVDSFLLTRPTGGLYGLALIDGETMAASRGNANAFMDAATTTIDSVIRALSNKLASSLYRSGWGDIGVISAINGAVVTLTNPGDIVNFGKNQLVQFSQSQSSNGLRNSGATTTLTVSAVDRGLGTVTFSAAPSTLTGGSNGAVSVGDYIFNNGDRQDSASPVARALNGLSSWLPDTAPQSGESFFGTDRSVDSRLSGLRYQPATGTPIDEYLIEGAQRVAREGGKLTHYFMSHAKYSALDKVLSGKVHYVDHTMADISFRGIQLQAGRGTIDVLPDHNCPDDHVYGLNLPMWKLYSIGKAVSVIDEDGLSMLRNSTSDGVEIRYAFRGNAGCRAPGHNISISGV